jgi:DNA-binding YbaB/EbfC family protein
MGIEELLSGPDGMKNLMAQAQQMQEQMKDAQARAVKVEVTGESGGGIVKVTANGGQEIIRIEIDPVAVDPRDVDMLQDLVTAATNDALRKAKEAMTQEMGGMADLIKASGLNV